MSLEGLFARELDLAGWEYQRTRENYVYRDVPIPGLRQEVYHRTIDGVLVSAGVFYFRNKPAYIAWGEKAAQHCVLHAPLSPELKILETRIGCPEVRHTRGGKGYVTGFVLDGKEVFGGGHHQTSAWDLQKFTRFLPLIGAFVLIITWATVRTFPLDTSHAWHSWMLDFMAGFFLLFGGIKFIDIQGFVRAYRKYDLIAKLFPAWGYVYAVLEVGIGVLYFTQTAIAVAHIATIVLLSSATVGVFQKLREKKGTTCACLGTFFNVPLTWFTLTENILMVGMAVGMLWYI